MYELPYPTIPQMLKSNAHQFADRIAISYKKKGKYQSLSYSHFYERVLMAARGLRKAGMVPGDKVAIFSENRAGWAIADFAIQSAQGVTVPIYATNTAGQAAYVINHCEAKIIFVSNRLQYEKLLTVREQLPQLEQVISSNFSSVTLSSRFITSTSCPKPPIRSQQRNALNLRR